MRSSEISEADDGNDDPAMGPCVGCGDLGEDSDVHHTACECDLESCAIVICDGCRMGGGNWAWSGEGNNAVEVHIDCYIRMEKHRDQAAAQRRRDHE